MFQHLKLNETFTGLFSTSDIKYTTELFDSFSTMEERTKVVKGKVKKVMVPVLMDLMTSPLMEAMKKSYQWEPLPPWQDKGQCHGKTPLVHARGVPPILHRNYSKADREKAREANGPIDIDKDVDDSGKRFDRGNHEITVGVSKVCLPHVTLVYEHGIVCVINLGSCQVMKQVEATLRNDMKEDAAAASKVQKESVEYECILVGGSKRPNREAVYLVEWENPGPNEDKREWIRGEDVPGFDSLSDGIVGQHITVWWASILNGEVSGDPAPYNALITEQAPPIMDMHGPSYKFEIHYEADNDIEVLDLRSLEFVSLDVSDTRKSVIHDAWMSTHVYKENPDLIEKLHSLYAQTAGEDVENDVRVKESKVDAKRLAAGKKKRTRVQKKQVYADLQDRLGDRNEGDTTDEATSEEQVFGDSDEQDDGRGDSDDERPLAAQEKRPVNTSERCMHVVTFRVLLHCTL